LRVLIAGAGVAGLTLAQLLRARGLHPVLIERAADHADAGYMLALMPLVDPVIRELGVQEAYRAESVRFHRYRLHGSHGQLLREYEIDTLLDAYGEYRGIGRGELMQVLSRDGAPVSYETTLAALQQTPAAAQVRVRGKDGEHEAEFDAVILADGLHSASRSLLLRPGQVTTFDTNWAGWVAWMEADAAHEDQGDEIWGSDFFVGVYPVKGRAGIFVGGNRDDMQNGPAAFVAHIRSQLRGVDNWIGRALATVEADADPYFWKLTDCRAETWAVDRAGLLGDAAAGFLPTAGIGAGMAMESAFALARQLERADRGAVGEALRAYELAQRPRVEAAQDNSRQLANLMFHRSRLLAGIRDLAVRVVPLSAALRPIRKLLDTAPAIEAKA
jgi:2-polyprenyl-6-methoxyphenol hydroxylase-like FAD-dependent oxidoreductase